MTVGDADVDLPTISDDLVVTKYKMAAEIVNKVLKEMITECKPGSSVRDLCILGDKKLKEETGKAFKKDKKLTKGESNCEKLLLISFSPRHRIPHVHLLQQLHLPLLPPGQRARLLPG